MMQSLTPEILEDHIVGLRSHIEQNQTNCCSAISHYFGQSSVEVTKSRAICNVSKELITLLQSQIAESKTTRNPSMFAEIADSSSTISTIDFPKKFSDLLSKNKLTSDEFFTEGSKETADSKEGYLREEFQRLVGYSSSEIVYVRRASSVSPTGS